MAWLIKFTFLGSSLLGHLAIWSTTFNQVHATGWVRRVRKTTEKIIYAIVIAGALVIVTWIGRREFHPLTRWEGWLPSGQNSLAASAVSAYCWFSSLVAIAFIARWVWRRFRSEPSPLLAKSARKVNVRALSDESLLNGWQAKCLDWIPGNQTLQLAVESKTLAIDELPQPLDKLKILHLSDLHFTGKVRLEYFRRVIEEANQWNADFVCLTGDICDKRECLSWVPQLLSKVEARVAKLFILGNHDCRIGDHRRLRKSMTDNGWLDASQAWQVFELNGAKAAFAGNEWPWFDPPSQLRDRLPSPGELSILLAHSPDLFRWGQKQGFRLVLAGHTHGGQVRFPVVGPVIAPSRQGVKYASGEFRQAQTVMHVTRGISADDPIRWNCPPELSQLTLTPR